MTVAKTFHDLLEYALGIPLLKSPVGLRLEVAMQGAVRNVLHDEDDVLARINYLVQLNDGMVSHLLHQLDFSLDTLTTVWLLKLVLLVNLHGDFLVRRAMKTDAHNSISSCTNLFSNDVVLEAALLAEDHGVVERVSSLLLWLIRCRLFRLLQVSRCEHLSLLLFLGLNLGLRLSNLLRNSLFNRLPEHLGERIAVLLLLRLDLALTFICVGRSARGLRRRVRHSLSHLLHRRLLHLLLMLLVVISLLNESLVLLVGANRLFTTMIPMLH